MASAIIMPRQGNTVESCIVSKWHVQKGDEVKEGDLLFTYETDKATFDAEANEAGTVLEMFFEEGEDVPVLTNMCVIGQKGDDLSEFIDQDQKSDEPNEEVQTQPVEIDSIIKEEKIYKSPDIRGISPRAKNLALKAGADLSKVTPSGPHGRIIEMDVRSLIEKGQLVSKGASEEFIPGSKEITGTGIGGRITTSDMKAKAEFKPVPEIPNEQGEDFTEEQLSNIRKIIGKSMHKSLSDMAQLTLNASFNAKNILNYRKTVKASMEKMGMENITLNDIILFAVSRILKNHKSLNAHFTGTSMKYYRPVHLGMAVDTNRGLMVPTLFNADQKSLNRISFEVKQLVEACKAGTINPDLLQGGTFTVTNLGALGIESFTPVINPPQTAILGVNNMVDRPVMTENGLSVYPAMALSLTFDHRAVDGAPAAKFLKELTEALECFELLLAK